MQIIYCKNRFHGDYIAPPPHHGSLTMKPLHSLQGNVCV